MVLDSSGFEAVDPMTAPCTVFHFTWKKLDGLQKGVHYNDRVITNHNPCIYGYLKTPGKPIYVGLFIGVKPFYKFDNDRRSFFGPVLLLWAPKIPKNIDNEHITK